LRAGEVVVGSGVQPEQLGVLLDFLERGRVDVRRVREDGFEHVAHRQVAGVALVVKNVASRDRRLGEVPHERSLAERQIAEAVGVELHDGGFADALEQIRAERHRRLASVRSRGCSLAAHVLNPNPRVDSTRSWCPAMCTAIHARR
jgi:hypothetical protein